MNITNKMKLRRISLLTSLGIILTTQNIGATSYSQTLTGDLETDSDQGYLITEMLPGHLTYNFLPDDKIHILGDHSVLPPEGSAAKEYHGVKIESGNTNDLDLTSLKNISIDLTGLSGVVVSGDSWVDINVEAVGVRDNGNGQRSFGDDTQINLSSTSGILAIDAESSVTFNPSLVGIDQSNSNGISSQKFGDRTQVILRDTLGDLTTGKVGSTVILNSSLVGIRQSGGTATATANQSFGNDSQIALSNNIDNISTEGDLNLNSNHVGIEQNSNIASISNASDIINARNNQIFGDNTQIMVSSTSGDWNVVKDGNIGQGVTQVGIRQNSASDTYAIDDSHTSIEASSVQKFGDNTKVNLNVTNGNQELTERGSANIQLNLTGINQRGDNSIFYYYDASSTSQSDNSQTFGDRTQIILSNTTGNRILGLASSVGQEAFLKGIDQEGSYRISSRGDGTSDYNNSNSQIFGDDTQIILSNTTGNLLNDTIPDEDDWSSAMLVSSLSGITQSISGNGSVRANGSHSGTITNSQVFGNNNQIILNNQIGNIATGDRRSAVINSNFVGVSQRASGSLKYNSGVNSLNFANTQQFGDNTLIRLSNRGGDLTVGDVTSGSLNISFEGISQDTGLYNGTYGGTSNISITNNQIFGNNTRIIMENNIGTLTSVGTGTLTSYSGYMGIRQSNSLDDSSYDGDISITNSQVFGDDTQVMMTNSLAGWVLGTSGYIMQITSMTGIEQYNYSRTSDDSITLMKSQTFGDNTRVILSSMRKEQPASEGGGVSSTENLNGISQNDSGGSQTFGKNTQILLKNTVGNLTIGNGGTGVSSDSTLIGIGQTDSKNSTQTFGDNTQVSLENAIGGLTTSDSENGIDVRIQIKGIDQWNYSDGNNQIFGNNTQINVNNHVGDLISGGGESAIHLESQVVGVGQNSSSGNTNQKFGENTQIKVESKAGAIQNADRAEIIFSAKGIEQINHGGASQMTFGNGTQIIAHAEIGVLEGVGGFESSPTVNAYGIYSAGTSEDDLVIEGDLSVQATVKPLVHDGVVLVDQANAYSLFATDDGAIRLNDQGAHKITLVGDLGTGDSGADNRVSVDISNSVSYFQGTAKAQEGNIFLTLADGASWRPQGDGDIDATFGTSGGQLDLKSGGVVDLAWWNNQNSTLNPSNQFRTLTIDHATLEDGGIFRVNSDVLHGQADRINIVDASGGGTQYIQVAYDPSMTGAGGVLEALPGNEPIVLDIQGGTALNQVVGKIYQSDSPLHQYEIDPTIVSDGHQIRIGSLHYNRTENLSETPYTVVDAQAAFRNLWKLEGNNVLRRMGDLRLAPEENPSGAWARVYSGKLTSDSSYQRTFEQKYTGMQVGYDREHLLRNGKLYTGVMFNYLDSSPSYSSGSGSLYSKGLGAYGSWIGNNNHHVDLVLRASRLNNEYHLVDNNGDFASGSYDAWAYGISAEYGYRAQLQNQFFLEPQVELSFGHIGSADHKTDSGLSVQQNGINTAQSRIGLLIGKDFGSKNQKGNAYLRGSWVHDFSSNGTLDGFYQGDRARLKTADHQGSHLELNLGANLKVNQKLDTYLELTKTFGGKVDTDWQVNGGIRLMW